ncbi:MAG: Spy/CpxP family protein refolding chaperone [Polyangiales bacterium]
MKNLLASMARGIGVVATTFAAMGTSVGCGGGAASGPPPATAMSAPEQDDVAFGMLEHHRYHHHGGVMLFIAMSLDTLGVSPEQRAAVEKIRGELHAKMQPARVAEQELESVLADGVAAASFDGKKVDAALTKLMETVEASHDACDDALDELHAALTPTQRAVLVEKVEAHWALWQRANSEGIGPTHSETDSLAMLATELDLTPEQVDRIRADLSERAKAAARFDAQEITTHLRAFGDAFRGDKFDAKALATARSAHSHLVGWGASHMTQFVTTVSPVLTADQRTKFAQRLREHSTHNPSAEANP